MKIRNLGSREKFLFHCNSNFLISFYLHCDIDIEKLIHCCNSVLSKIGIFNCYCKEDSIYYLNHNFPTVKIEEILDLDTLIKGYLKKQYTIEYPWIDVIYHKPTNSININIEHTLGDVASILNFMGLVTKEYKNDNIFERSIIKSLENQVDIGQVPILDYYGENKGENKHYQGISIDKASLNTSDILFYIQKAYFEVFDLKTLQFGLNIDLRRVITNLDGFGYLSHTHNFNLNKNDLSYFRKEMKRILFSLPHLDMGIPFSSFYSDANQKQVNRLGCSFSSEKSCFDIDSQIIKEIIPYTNCFYFKKENNRGFIIGCFFNKRLNLNFCYDIRNISHQNAKKYIQLLREYINEYC